MVAAYLFIIIVLTAGRITKEGDMRYIYALPIFYSVRLAGLVAGALKQLPQIFKSKLKKENIRYKY